jgi:DNA invertase Pin-like site-specific DNA recombinase
MERQTIGYCRVSTTNAQQQQSLPHQRSLVRRHGCDRILEDSESGLEVQRPGYQELRQLIAAGLVSEVVATEFSRLGRDALECDQFVLLCDAMGCTVRTISDGVITMATADDLLMTRLRGSMAQAESMRLSTRIRRGLNEGRQQGRPLRRAPWGYQLAADRTRLEPHPVEFTRARRFIDELRANDWRMVSTLRSIEPTLMPLSGMRACRHWLANPVLRGGLAYPRSGIVYWDQHQPLLSHDEFAAYEQSKASRRRSWGANADRQLRPLTSLCRCAACNSTLKYYAGRRQACLRCSNEQCNLYYRSIREAVIVAYAVEQLRTSAATFMTQAAEHREDPQQLELQRQIDSLERLQDPDLAPAVAAKRQRLDQLRMMQRPVDALMVKRLSLPGWWEAATADELTVILHAMVRRILVCMEQRVPVGIDLSF